MERQSFGQRWLRARRPQLLIGWKPVHITTPALLDQALASLIKEAVCGLDGSVTNTGNTSNISRRAGIAHQMRSHIDTGSGN